jgi:hypothetical protein
MVHSARLPGAHLPITMKSKPNLTRFDYESTGFKGWRVSVTRHGEIFTRYFSDRQFSGSSKKSLAAAQAALAAFLKELEKSPVTTARRAPKGRVTGVSETTYLNPASGETRVLWVASWPEEGKRKVVKFPVAKLGARKAKQMALDARREAEERLGLNLVRRFKRDDVARLKKVLASL